MEVSSTLDGSCLCSLSSRLSKFRIMHMTWRNSTLILNQILTEIPCTLSRAFDILSTRVIQAEKRRAHNGQYNKHFKYFNQSIRSNELQEQIEAGRLAGMKVGSSLFVSRNMFMILLAIIGSTSLLYSGYTFTRGLQGSPARPIESNTVAT